MDRAHLQAVLAAVLAIGVLGLVGPGFSYGAFTDAHGGNATFNASTAFEPNADAGGPYELYEDSSIELDGTASTSSGNMDSYSWKIVDGNGTLSGNTTSTPTYDAPVDVASDMNVTVELTVTDGGRSDTDQATITVRDADGGCGASTLTFCTVDFYDTGGGSYDVTYNLEDPSGGDTYDHVEVTLERVQNNNNYNLKDTSSSQQTAATLSVSDNNGGGRDYRIQVSLYNASGAVVECQQATDTADGTDPSSTTTC